MPYPKIKVDFLDATEIRMGSPFHACDIELTGSWTPQLPERRWQDIAAESPNGRFLALVAWNIRPANEPRFQIILIDKKVRGVSQSESISGCCQSLTWSANSLVYQTFSVLDEDQMQNWPAVNSD